MGIWGRMGMWGGIRDAGIRGFGDSGMWGYGDMGMKKGPLQMGGPVIIHSELSSLLHHSEDFTVYLDDIETFSQVSHINGVIGNDLVCEDFS